jgi:hypothetical protein
LSHIAGDREILFYSVSSVILNGDPYFKTSRPGHNLDRFRVQAALVESIEMQEERMREFVAQCAEQG